jgi:hypothetical protein
MVDISMVPFVPVVEHDFGCRDVLIGGGPALKKARPDPVGESGVFWGTPSRAEVNFKPRRRINGEG